MSQTVISFTVGFIVGYFGWALDYPFYITIPAGGVTALLVGWLCDWRVSRTKKKALVAFEKMMRIFDDMPAATTSQGTVDDAAPETLDEQLLRLMQTQGENRLTYYNFCEWLRTLPPGMILATDDEILEAFTRLVKSGAIQVDADCSELVAKLTNAKEEEE